MLLLYYLEAAVTIYEQDEAIKAKKLEQLTKETIPFYFEKFEAIAKKNNGHLALGRVSEQII